MGRHVGTSDQAFRRSNEILIEMGNRYRHAEAFCLMTYISDDGQIVETLWNSRDGVTPFVIMSKDGKIELTHTAWKTDKCVPDFKPNPGDRMFVDLTMEKSTEEAKRRIEMIESDPSYEKFVDPDNKPTVESLAESIFEDGIRPDVVTA